jgi:hypothetical protein
LKVIVCAKCAWFLFATHLLDIENLIIVAMADDHSDLSYDEDDGERRIPHHQTGAFANYDALVAAIRAHCEAHGYEIVTTTTE